MHLVTDTEEIRAAIRRIQFLIQGPQPADFYSADFRQWVGVAADILCTACLQDQKDQFHNYIQERLGSTRGDWMSELLERLFEHFDIQDIEQLWP